MCGSGLGSHPGLSGWRCPVEAQLKGTWAWPQLSPSSSDAAQGCAKMPPWVFSGVWTVRCGILQWQTPMFSHGKREEARLGWVRLGRQARRISCVTKPWMCDLALRAQFCVLLWPSRAPAPVTPQGMMQWPLGEVFGCSPVPTSCVGSTRCSWAAECNYT